ncbi:hypothetical protein LTR91_009323 [Friedmanniomyces endolithicus]|uniref:Uncharacterized protein n=1 Tax=Friedmanniomyces endolithicus TaxID=329885 RepID=A0AAN6KKT2_9PEZI|nr:hypothetical protein LTR35_003729 [Friedmanniomyces endolithicus]KAK0289882.1 hypothetical protein LTS00_009019 [Friedmanniomyces endolithicus]KAK0326147.1 hypothetical protein LTR82_002892 [Friedmanniomyces endolithicus]KAK0925576.1 hypothetical protein LTR57_004877 [Friedmanniomyces endolithicus]KAK0989170.1 hypothetical protein LTR91_009323 [Friedmanniomyces endolithicus]
MPRRPDREVTAAYAASQQLFDALKAATDRAGEQRIHLAKARDTVQNLHVNLVDTTKTDDAQKHELYVDCLMKAWTSATEAYCKVFEELCNVSAADATVGRAAGKGHEQFKVMAGTATAASEQAKSYRVVEKPIGATSENGHEVPIISGKRVRDSDEQEREEEQVVEGSGQTVNTKRQRKRARLSALKNPGADVGIGMQGTGAEAMNMSEEVEVDLQRPAPVQHHTPASQHEGPQPEPEMEPVSAGKENNGPVVEYEDVSAEVTARLKAKAEKKRAKKEAKKRKRESGDTALIEAAGLEKPSVKKVKLAGVLAEKDAAVGQGQTKRRPDDGAEQHEGGSPAKRRKGKA